MQRAVVRDSADALSYFDLALLLEAIGLPGEAGEAWSRAAAKSTFRTEAQSHAVIQRNLDSRIGGLRRLDSALVQGVLSDSLLNSTSDVAPESLREFALQVCLPA